MASRIKGITVVIGGDTTGLDKALKNVNSTIKTTQSSLRDVNKLLKLDPTNANLLSQKQKMLKESIGATKEKLDSLRQAQEQAKQQLENGDLGQGKYDALQRENEALLVICEGRFHQVKRMLAALGREVTSLKRIREGSLSLDPRLDSGEWRALDEKEKTALYLEAGLEVPEL